MFVVTRPFVRQEFLRPIITPYELEVALQPEPIWTGKYVLDFGKLSLLERDVPASTYSATFLVFFTHPLKSDRR